MIPEIGKMYRIVVQLPQGVLDMIAIADRYGSEKKNTSYHHIHYNIIHIISDGGYAVSDGQVVDSGHIVSEMSEETNPEYFL